MRIKKSDHKPIIDQYTSGKSLSEIARNRSIGMWSVWNVLRKNGVKRRPQGGSGHLRTQDKHPNWRGMDATYQSKHDWIRYNFGKADHCEIDPTHKAKRFEWSNISGKYLRERSDYRQLCVSCHRRHDYGNFCKHGHEFTEENTYWDSDGWRKCKACNRERQRKRRELVSIALT